MRPVAAHRATRHRVEMDTSTATVDFRLIDPPRVAPQPVSPNRLLLLPLTLVLAIAAGLAIPFAASQFRPVLFDARALRELTGLPLLGTVSRKMEESSKRKMKKDLRRFIVAASSLFVAYGAGIGLLVFLGLRSV